MMIKANIPNDKRDATLYLKAYKNAIIELSATFDANGIETSPHINGTMHNLVELINELSGENNE